jgi:hypothetical protein
MRRKTHPNVNVADNQSQMVEWDGHRFAVRPSDMMMIHLYLTAKQARAGDRDAVEFLTAFKVVIVDADGKNFWPPDAITITP